MWQESTVIRPPGLDTIQEFKVENNGSSAKYTRMTNIVMSTKSGTNQVHGSAFEANRDNRYGKSRSRTDFGTFPDLAAQRVRRDHRRTGLDPQGLQRQEQDLLLLLVRGVPEQHARLHVRGVPTAAMRAGDYSGLLDSQGRLTTLYDPIHESRENLYPPAFSLRRKGEQHRSRPPQPSVKYMYSAASAPTFPNLNPVLEYNWYGPSPDSTRKLPTPRIDHRFRKGQHLCAWHVPPACPDRMPSTRRTT